MLGGRVKFPDDPDIRVRLSDNFSAELRRRDPRKIAQKLAASEARLRLHPSSITRYALGQTTPKLAIARKLANALDWSITEAVAGYSERYAPPMLDWGRVLLYARHFRQRAIAFLELFRAIVAPNTHFSFPNDHKRGWRRRVRPPADDTGYACFEVTLDEAVTGVETVELLVSYCLFDRPKLFIDFGTITVSADQVRCVETWTRRKDGAPLLSDHRSFWVATWIDGKAVDFVIRSNRPFRVSQMVPEEMLQPERGPMIKFKPGPIHQYELAERSNAESAC